MSKPDLQHIIPGKKYLLAVSGGMDSMVLLHSFMASGLNCMVAHVNYQLRGEDSDLDEELVTSWCTRQSIPCHVLRIDLKEEMRKNGQPVQICAREVRYTFFREILLKENLDCIVTAHHADDNLETLLFHFFRGSGIEGLVGIPSQKKDLIRPLLHWSKEDIKDYCLKYEVEYRDDISNAATDYTRNKIRLDVIPQLEKIFPTLKENLRGNIHRLQNALTIYKQRIEEYRLELIDHRGEDDYIPILKLKKVEPLETILYELLKPYGFDYEQSVQALKLLNSESGHWVGNHSHKVIRNRNFLIVTKKEELKSGFILIEENMTNIETGDFTLRIKKDNAEGPVSKDANICTTSFSDLVFPLILRKWKQGDYLYPFGMKKKKKVSRVLIDAKIPLHEKDKIWVLESDRKIIWVLGLKTDNRFRVESSSQNVIFRMEKKSNI